MVPNFDVSSVYSSAPVSDSDCVSEAVSGFASASDCVSVSVADYDYDYASVCCLCFCP